MNIPVDYTPSVARGDLPYVRYVTTSALQNNRSWGSVSLQGTGEFVLPSPPSEQKDVLAVPIVFPPSGTIDSAEIILPSVALSRTYGACSTTPFDLGEEPWERKNRRRIYLIKKQFAGGLCEAEAKELGQLEEDVSAHVNAIAPLPFEMLDRLEALLEGNVVPQE